MEKCKECSHYGLYQMIISGKPYGYTGDIPCLRCSRFSMTEDNFTPIGTPKLYPKELDGEEKQ